jgi:hypothetical protein
MAPRRPGSHPDPGGCRARRMAAVSDGGDIQGDWWTLTAEAVVGAVAGGGDPGLACARFGRQWAQDGASLPETLADLTRLYLAAGRTEPPYGAVSVCVAWAEESVQFLGALSCEDPLTGLATMAHLRTRLSELYRGAERGARPLLVTHALLVVDLPDGHLDPWARAFRLADVGRCLRAVLSGGETIARAARSRVVAVVDRGSDLPRSVAALRRLLADWPIAPAGAHVIGAEVFGAEWFGAEVRVEALPRSAESAARLLDELAGPRS